MGGDKKKQREQAQNTLNTQYDAARAQQDRLRNDVLVPQQQQAQEGLDKALAIDTSNYENIMNQYKNYGASIQNPDRLNFQGISAPVVNAATVNYNRSSEMDNAMRGYQEFSSTGGYNEEDISNLRARATSPISSFYSTAMNNLNRNRSLQGGYSPNYAAATSKLGRELPGQISSATQNVNAELANMIRSGRLSGLSGLSSLSATDANMRNQMLMANQSAEMQAAMANQSAEMQAGQFNSQGRLSYEALNQQMQNAANAQRFSAIEGQNSLYGSKPGLTNTFQDQVNAATNALLTGQGQNNTLASNQVGQQTNIGNMNTGNGILGGLGKIGNMIAPFLGGGARNNNSVWSTDGGNAYNTPYGANNDNTIWGDGMINEDYSDLGSYPGANQPNPSGLFQEPTWEELQRRQGR